MHCLPKVDRWNRIALVALLGTTSCTALVVLGACGSEADASHSSGPAGDGSVAEPDAATAQPESGSPSLDAGAPDQNASVDSGAIEAASPPDVQQEAGMDSATVEDSPRPPGAGVMHTAAQLQFMRERRGEEPWKAATAQLLSQAQTALDRTPAPKEDFDIPFYYGDPAAAQAAKEGLRQDALAAYALALGYQLADSDAERQKYAAKSIEFLNGWASINKTVSGADGDLVVLYTGMPLLYAGDLLMNWEGWSSADRLSFLSWVGSVFQDSASNIEDRVNNWGDWGTLGMVAGAAVRNDLSTVLLEADRIKGRIADEIDDNGELPEENKRTNSGMWYTFFAMASMTTAAHIIRNTTGVDLFSYAAPNGRSIKLALDKEFFYAVHPDQWPYPLPDGIEGDIWKMLYPCDDTIQMPQVNGWPGTLFEVMSDTYHVAEWEGWVQSSRPLQGFHAWIYPTLMRQTP